MSLVTNERVIDERMLTQVERILHSDTLHGSEVLRHLLKFLAEKSAMGEAEHLKEYTVAVDALGKPESYDPRHDSAVRIQVGRLRQKLSEYYRTEGKEDLVVIDLPKGRFRLTCDTRPSVPEIAPPLPENRSLGRHLIPLASLMSLALLIAVAWGSYATIKLRQLQTGSASKGVWTPELEELWRPFIATNRPLILAIEDLLFVEYKHGAGVYYRDRSINDWSTLLNSPSVDAVRKTLNNPVVQPSHYYTAFGEVMTSLMVGKLFGGPDKNISLVRTSELSWQQLADNNVLFVGMQDLFNPQLHGMPVRPQLVPISAGVQNLRPNTGEPQMFPDNYSTAPTEEGEVYALITRLPGPVGSGYIETFTSNRAAGYVGAVQWFTDPHFAAIVVSNLKKPSGEIPRYYQVLLKVRFSDQVPTETSYVLGRELQ